jgi:hypothetical protein
MSAATTHAENPFAGQGSVLLDIGGDVGALVVTMPAAMEGVEVEIRPGHGRQAHHHDHPRGHAHHPHVAVVNRPTPAGQVPSLVFPEVQEGGYGLYLKESDEEILTVSVAGGEVTSVEWPS